MSKSLNTCSITKIHHNPPPTQMQSTSLKALVLLLAQMAEQEKIAIRSRGDNCMQRCMMFNKKNWSWVTVVVSCLCLPSHPPRAGDKS